MNANEAMIAFYESRARRNRRGSIAIFPSGGLIDGPFNIPTEGLALAVDTLSSLTDVPLLSVCRETATCDLSASATIHSKKVLTNPNPLETVADEEEPVPIHSSPRSVGPARSLREPAQGPRVCPETRRCWRSRCRSAGVDSVVEARPLGASGSRACPPFRK
jgi:hypothetical protein